MQGTQKHWYLNCNTTQCHNPEDLDLNTASCKVVILSAMIKCDAD
jgi:hypothetical protein